MVNKVTVAKTDPDLYGQRHPIETKDLIVRKQEEFFIELSKIPAHKRKNATLAQTKCAESTRTEFIQLFLRCEVYNADLAAARYVKYWDTRVEVFGEHAFDPILDHDVQDDAAVMDLGMLLFAKRQAGDRTFLYIDPAKMDSTKYTRQRFMQAFWYQVHQALMTDEVMQKKGLLILVYPYKASVTQLDPPLAKQFVSSLTGIMPIRLSGMHICHPSMFTRLAWPMVKVLMSARMRERIMFHSGHENDVIELLTSKYNFHVNDIPTDMGGKGILGKCS